MGAKQVRAYSRVMVLVAVMAVLAGCGAATGIDLANAYMVAGTPEQALALFADNAVRVDVSGAEYIGKRRIHQQLTEAFTSRARGEVVEPAHVEGDHVTWVAISYDRVSTQQYRVRSNIWVEQGKIARFTSSFAV